MTDLPLHVVTETSQTITLGWTPIQCEGYEFLAGGQRVSNTWDATRSSIRFGKVPSGQYAVRALGVVAEGKYPAVPPPVVFGKLLPDMLPPASGPTIRVANANELVNALKNCAYGSIIDSGNNTIDLAGATAEWSRPGGTVTTEARVKVKNGGPNAGVRITGNQFRAVVDSSGSAEDGVKITDGASYVEVRGRLFDNRAQGLMVSGTGHHRQAIGVRFDTNGSNENKDHSVYWSTARPGDLIACCEGLNPWAYNLQLYPQGDGLVVTMCSLRGGQQHADARGGVVLGDGDGKGRWANGTLVGLSIKDSPAAAAMHVIGAVTNTRAFDCCEIRNAGGGFIPSAGLTYTNCVHAESVLVDPSRYGWVPPVDIDGRPFVPGSVKAGCYA